MLVCRRAALLGIVISLAALSARADSILLGTHNPGNFGAALSISQVAAQPFTLTQGVTLSLPLTCFSLHFKAALGK